MIIKVPKGSDKEVFMVDCCDGDAEDEFDCLEGPHVPQHTTVADLLDRKRSQPRLTRRQQGHTTKREVELVSGDPQ
jgi:hypothetical protein